MEHDMKLQPRPFEQMKRGKKKVELRLYDEKRSQICVGDSITFTQMETKEKLRVKVISVDRFADFFQLFKSFDKVDLGYMEEERANPEDMYDYYAREEIEKYGVVAISVQTETN